MNERYGKYDVIVNGNVTGQVEFFKVGYWGETSVFDDAGNPKQEVSVDGGIATIRLVGGKDKKAGAVEHVSDLISKGFDKYEAMEVIQERYDLTEFEAYEVLVRYLDSQFDKAFGNIEISYADLNKIEESVK